MAISEIRAVQDDLRAWQVRQPPELYAPAERVLMSLVFCRRNGSGLRELADDVELLRQARLGSVQPPNAKKPADPEGTGGRM